MNELKASNDTVDNIVFKYFDMNNRCFKADVDNVVATNKLMHRVNTIFFNPFYKDLSMYLALPIVNTLMSQKNAL